MYIRALSRLITSMSCKKQEAKKPKPAITSSEETITPKRHESELRRKEMFLAAPSLLKLLQHLIPGQNPQE